MRKVEILLNEKKIKAEGEYTSEEFHQTLDEYFIENADMEKRVESDGTIGYHAKVMKDENHYAKIWKSIGDLADCKWFTGYLIKFVYGDTYGSDNPNDYFFEDILKEWDKD